MALPRIVNLVAESPATLRITWKDGGTETVDMTGVIKAFEPFAPLADPTLFARAEIVGHGSGIGWPNGLDYSATSLAELAREQRPMSGEEFDHWRREFHISIKETARLFGVSESTVKVYRKAPAIPVAWQIACNAMLTNPNLFFAHFQPSRAGRPSKRGAD